MNSKNDGGRAFPSPGQRIENRDGFMETVNASEGMTLRDYFAAKVMAEMVNNPNGTWETDAKCAYAAADAMLKEREK